VCKLFPVKKYVKTDILQLLCTNTNDYIQMM